MGRRSNGPWFREAKNAWYVKIDGRQVPLGVSGKGNKKAAQDAFYRLMADGPPEKKPKTQGRTVQDLIDTFLTDAAGRLKTATVAMYSDHLAGFGKSLGRSPLDRLTPANVSGWLARLGVCDTTKGIRLRSVSACIGWGVRNGWLDSNPVQKVSRPKSRSRSEEAVIPTDHHSRMMAVASPLFRLVLQILHGTGCRPGEIRRITAANFYPDAGLVRLNEHKADHTGRPRLIFLTPALVEALKTQAAKYPEGPIIRSRAGKPWTARAITQAIRRVRKKAGVKGAIAYGYRHTLATDGLANGLPEAHVAE